MKIPKIRFPRRNPPAPTFRNVRPNGAGWYRYIDGKWQRFYGMTTPKLARYLSYKKLASFAADALEVIKND